MKLRLDRRTFLRGCGVLLPLPFLEAMMPSGSGAQMPVQKRWATFYFPHGCYHREWAATPGADGKPDAPGYLQAAMNPIRDDIVWINRLRNPQDGKGDHETAAGAFLNCGAMVLPGPNFEKSADQIVAEQLAEHYRVPSLVLSADGFQQAASCCRDVEVGLNNISYLGGTSPATKIQSPLDLFNMIFSADLSEEGRRLAALRQQRRLSVLDFNRRQTERVRATLGAADRERLGDYLDSVREVERRLQLAGMMSVCEPPAVPPADPGFLEHNQLMYDLVFLAFQCNVTPVVTFMQDFEFSDRLIDIPGVTSGHHSVSHHEENADRIAQYRLIQAFYAERFRSFVERMKSVRDADGRTLLENSVLMLCSGMTDGNSHDRTEIPMVVAGTGGGMIRTGRVIEADQPLAALYRTTMRIMGATGPAVDTFGDATMDLALA